MHFSQYKSIMKFQPTEKEKEVMNTYKTNGIPTFLGLGAGTAVGLFLGKKISNKFAGTVLGGFTGLAYY